MLEGIATQKQKNAVMLIEKHCHIRFSGTTKRDVWAFIGLHLSEAARLQSIEDTAR